MRILSISLFIATFQPDCYNLLWKVENMKKTYNMIIERDPESTWLVGEIVELPGCYTQAPDLPTLESNIREAISVYLKTA